MRVALNLGTATDRNGIKLFYGYTLFKNWKTTYPIGNIAGGIQNISYKVLFAPGNIRDHKPRKKKNVINKWKEQSQIKTMALVNVHDVMM